MRYDLIVIGSGPGGYFCAIRVGQESEVVRDSSTLLGMTKCKYLEHGVPEALQIRHLLAITAKERKHSLLRGIERLARERLGSKLGLSRHVAGGS